MTIETRKRDQPIFRAVLASPPKLGAIVMMAGSIVTPPISQETERHVLSLPVRTGEKLLDYWQADYEMFCQVFSTDSVPWILRTGTRLDRSKIDLTRYGCVEIPDSNEMRGVGGSLRDLAAEFDPATWMIVVTALGIPNWRLAEMIPAMVAGNVDASVLATTSGEFGQLIAIRAGALTEFPKAGYFDLKEQGLQRLAKDGNVNVVTRPDAGFQVVRTRKDYLSAIHMLLAKQRRPFDEPDEIGFSLVEAGAQVHPTAVLHDSVVLRNAIVGPGCRIVRSVIRENAQVLGSRMVIDTVITRDLR